jgi:hypothetical protein
MIQALRTSLRSTAAPFVKVLAALFVLCSLQVPAANAAMVGTESLVISHAERAKVVEFLQRDQVQQAFTAQGVDAEDALARVDRLTDAEIATLAEKIDEMPAGGDIVGALLLVFFVLLITDLLGLTHVYPFVNR